MASLDGKVIAITGAASGIGKATAHLLASRGATLALSDVNLEVLNAVEQAIRTEHASCKICSNSVNVAKSDEVKAWLEGAVQECGKLDGAVNLAGISGTFGSKTITEMDDKEWDSVMDVNVRGVFNCMRAELPQMNDHGSIINASSVAGLRGVKGAVAYCTSKHAVIGLTRAVAKEACERNIKVNAIAPGSIDTPMVRKIDDDFAKTGQEDFIARTIPMVPLARIAQPVEVAKLIAFLLSDENSYITGSVYTIDGGLSA